MKKIFVMLIISAIINFGYCTNAAFCENGVTKVKLYKSDNLKTQKVSNGLFSIALPKETKGLYTVKKKSNGIYIYDKSSKKAGFGGFAFGIKAYKNPADHAMMPGGRKLGELTDKKHTLYDIVLIQPTDVQYDYVKGEADSYHTLYKLADTIDNNISGKGKSVYHNKQGMLGKNLYKEIIKKHITAVKEKWDSTKLENENMSYMYNVITSSQKNPMSKIGYTYYDLNGDGIEELIIGEIADGEWKGVIYDIYTMVNRKPAHVVSGGSRNRYFACDGTFICNEYSSGALESGWRVYILVENSTELFPQVGFKYDGYKDSKNPWFISYDFLKDKWDNVSEETFKERKKVFDRYERFDYVPFSMVEK